VAAVVLDRSGSALYSALAFVVSFLPGVGGSLILGPLADRLPRRELMVGCDLLRAGLVSFLAAAVAADAPLWTLMGLLLVAELFSAPFDAAGSAVLPDVLSDPAEYQQGAGVSRALYQVNQSVGLGAGGLFAYAVSAQGALWLDAGTFMVSAVMLLVGMRYRPAALAGSGGGAMADVRRDVGVGFGLVFGDRLRRTFVGTAWLAAGLLIVPEGVALVYAVEQHHSRLGGALIAALPAGAAVGSWVVSALPPHSAVRAVRPLLLASAAPLLGTGLDLGVYPTMALWVVAGAGQAFLLPLMVVANLSTAPERRGAMNGVAASGFNAAVATGFLLAGWSADGVGPTETVLGAGVLVLVLAVAVSAWWPRAALEAALDQDRSGLESEHIA
jgi:MFS family permease